jgi:hypothetical protein
MSKDEKFYVRVVSADGTYDVGPFSESGIDFSRENSAVGWICKQIGFLKTQNESAQLIKHKWAAVQEESGFFPPVVEVKAEIAGFVFEVFEMKPPESTSVIETTLEKKYVEAAKW